MSTQKGSCHCGAVSFEIESTDLSKAIACNCSMCGRSGTWLVFLPASSFHLNSGEDRLTDYQFGRHHIHHLFCSVCGIKPFARGADPQGNQVVAVNVRCLEGVDLQTISPTWFNGAAL